ncbi:hypothetical protein G5I_14253 [Acromyrmex echinatior]|uniref:Uncharacterized protein n=1 Tax=Acromyrmex echinatior TaxID=103372 RepID=F4X7B3_ACREC|nr:hypothetical protein G5I_14253 [Acromyrmex echinatior]
MAIHPYVRDTPLPRSRPSSLDGPSPLSRPLRFSRGRERKGADIIVMCAMVPSVSGCAAEAGTATAAWPMSHDGITGCLAVPYCALHIDGPQGSQTAEFLRDR